MALQGKTFDNQLVRAKDDGGLYGAVLSDGILWGCERYLNANKLTLAAGQVIVGGRVITIEGSEVVTLNPTFSANYGRVLIEVDLNQLSTQETFEQVKILQQYSSTDNFPDLTLEDINNTGKIRQWCIATYRVLSGDATEIIDEPPKAAITPNSIQGNAHAEKLSQYGQGVIADCNALFNGSAVVTSNTANRPPGTGSGLIVASNGLQFCQGYQRVKSLGVWQDWKAVPADLTTPAASGDIANKGYVDEQITDKLNTYSQGYITNCNDLMDGTAVVTPETNNRPPGGGFGVILASNGSQICLGYQRVYSKAEGQFWSAWEPLPIGVFVKKSGDVVTGDLTFNNRKITGLANPTNNSDVANKLYVDSLAGLRLPLAGGTMSGSIDMGGNRIKGLYAPVDAADAVRKTDLDALYDVFIKKAGDVVTGDLTFNGGRISGLSVPTVSHGAANKAYVDTQIDAKLSRSKGEFSPALYAGTNPAGGYASRKGYLVMNGNLCYISVYMSLNSWSNINQSTALTIKRATGKVIPQAALGGTRYELTVGITNYLHDGKVICAYIEPESDEIKICTRMGTALTRADFGDTAIISISGVYPIA